MKPNQHGDYNSSKITKEAGRVCGNDAEEKETPSHKDLFEILYLTVDFRYVHQGFLTGSQNMPSPKGSWPTHMWKMQLSR